LKRGEEMFARYGSATIFFARFIFGLRVFAGPLAGVLRMRWRAFALFNFLERRSGSRSSLAPGIFRAALAHFAASDAALQHCTCDCCCGGGGVLWWRRRGRVIAP